VLKVLTALVLLVGSSWSEPQTPSIGKSIQYQNGQANPKKYQADKGDTVIVKVVPFPSHKEDSTEAKNEADAHTESEARLVEFTHDLVIWTRVLAGLTGVLGVVGFLQVTLFNRAETRATKSDTATRISRQKELRAYIHIKEVVKIPKPGALPYDIRNVYDIVDGFRYRVIVKNYGKTPAHKIQFDIRSSAVISDRGDIERHALAYTVRNPAKSLGPDGEVDFIIELPAAKYTQTEIDNIMEGKRVVYITGAVRYFDEFIPEDRVTEFRFIHEFIREKGDFFSERISVDADGNSAS